jgi:hypothetical protein
LLRNVFVPLSVTEPPLLKMPPPLLAVLPLTVESVSVPELELLAR